MDEKTPRVESILPPPEIAPEVVTYESEPPTNTGALMPKPTRWPAVVHLKSKKWLTLVVAGLIVLVGAASVMAYALWYQNPQKVITDGIVKAIAAKSVAYTATLDASQDNTAKIAVDGSAANGQQSGNVTLSLASTGKSYQIKGTVIIDKANDVYVKLTNVADLLRPYRVALPQSGQTLFDNLQTKLGSSWIKLSPADLKNYNGALATVQQCTNAVVTKLQGDKASARQLATIYQKHQFISIDKKLGSKNGSLGYQISANQPVLKAFERDFQTTTAYKALHACNPQLSLASATGLFDGASGQTTVYISRFTHQITSLNVTSTDDKTKTVARFAVAPRFNVPVVIQVPKKTTTVTQLLHDLQAVLQSAAKP